MSRLSLGLLPAKPLAAVAVTATNPTAPAAFTVPLVAQAVAVVSEAATDLDTVAAALKVLHTEVTAYEVDISALIIDVAAIRLATVNNKAAIDAIIDSGG